MQRKFCCWQSDFFQDTFNVKKTIPQLSGFTSKHTPALSFGIQPKPETYCLYTNPEYFVDDSGYDFDPSCYATGATCSGRLVMSFEPLCIEELEARQIVAEFVNLDNLCGNTGDVNGDGATNVVDVVQIVTHVLSESGTLDAVGRCEADSNGDGVVNVVDIVLLVNGILGGSALDHGAQTDEAVIEYSNKEISLSLIHI